MKKNYNAIDIMKFISAFLVIIVHTYPFYTSVPTFGFITSNIVGRVVIPFFFLAAGYFFQKGNPSKERFKKYTFKLLRLYIVWSVLYIPLGIHLLNGFMEMTPVLWAAGSFLALVNFGTYFHLWYMAALIFAIVFCYYYLRKFSMKSLVIVGFILFCFGCLETYYGLIPNGTFLDALNIYLMIFFTTRNGLFFGILFVSLGMAVAKYDLASKVKYSHISLLSLVFFIALCVEAFSIKSLGWAIDYNFYIMVVPFSYCWFVTLLKTNVTLKLDYAALREYSVIIYFSHGIFLELIPILLGTQYGYLFDSGVFRLFSVLIPTLLVSYLIKHKIPLLQ
ncbi:acyltransferase [Anaerorhabdus sp.]|jgi:surface polysaccharide O-acyltransferase-like enzyme|uniref:acyltransferase n=1 Tax=Anaerorhabdus sp. TaxID=1872524 RepID=UPI002FCA61E4